jgi:TolA-binding protein
LVVVALSASALSCAHTDEKEQASRQAERREVDLLRERVARLERQSSDTHAKLDRVIAKLDERDAAVGDRAERRETVVVQPSVSETVTPDELAEASKSIDISRENDDGDDDDAPASSDTHGESREAWNASSPGAPIVIDADALRRLDARESSSPSAKKRAVTAPSRQTPSARDGKAPKASYRATTNETTKGTEPHPTAKADTVQPSSPKLVYKRAMQHFDDGRCDLAEQGFSAILTRAPDHDLADNALYWTGVCRQRAGRLEEARQLFADVALRYPGSNKLADALFSLGEVHEAQGDPVTARMYYAELVTRFPAVERAPEAEQALRRLDKR